MLDTNFDIAEEKRSYISKSGPTHVFRAVRKQFTETVIVKTTGTERPSPEHVERYRHEFQVLSALKAARKDKNSNHVIGVIDLVMGGQRPYLVMEDVSGNSLKKILQKEDPPFREKLEIAVKIASGLCEIYRGRVTHKKINPSNIVYNPGTGVLKLIDFSMSSHSGEKALDERDNTLRTSTLPYMSPEQTGRMSVGPDWRTDYYSFGITLYELFTGQLPFPASDPIELVHAHMAMTARPMCDVDGRIPRVLSDIVYKLMSKNPGERYSSPFGIRYDLESCLEQFSKIGQIQAFGIGQKDISDRLQIPPKLYGREKELDRLHVAVRDVARGQCKMVLVTGEAGVGKSALVNEFDRSLTTEKQFFISGKCDQLDRSTPYAPLVHAFQHLIKQVLTENQNKIAEWNRRLLSALGPNGQVMVNVIPELELICGSQPEVPELGPVENVNRFHYVFGNFINAFACQSRPLVIFLDDLQWIDSASLELVKMCLSNRTQYLYLIGAYRHNEVDSAHPLSQALAGMKKNGTAIETIHLEPLDRADVNQLLSETFLCSRKESDSLAQLCIVKTRGNPFFLTRFIHSLHQENLIYFNAAQSLWQLNTADIREAEFTDNVVDLLVTRIRKLPQNTAHLLSLAACIGNGFDIHTLSLVCEKSIQETLEDLVEPLQDNLVQPAEIPYPHRASSFQSPGDQPDQEMAFPVYRFTHDRIQQAAYSLISDPVKAGIHLKIGRKLLAEIPENRVETHIFDIVDQLNLSCRCIEDEQERAKLAALNFMAGKKAKLSAAYEVALKYLNTGIHLLTEGDWNDRYDLSLSLHEAAAETAFLCGQFESVEVLTETILERANGLLDKVTAYEIQIQAAIARNELRRAVDISLPVLRSLGVRFPARPRQFHALVYLLRTKAMLSGKDIESLVNMPEMSDPRMIAAIRILQKAGTATYFAYPELMPIFVFQMVILSLKYGNAKESCFAYASYGLVLCGVLGEIEKGFRFGQLSLELVEAYRADEYRARIRFVFNCLIRHWKDPLRQTLTPLEDAYQIGVETGDFEYASYPLYVHCSNAYLSGIALERLAYTMGRYGDRIRHLKQETSLQMHNIFHQTVLNLLGQNKIPWELTGSVYDEREMEAVHLANNHRNALNHLYLNRLILCYMFDQFPQAVQNARKAHCYLDGVVSAPNIPFFHFYDSLAGLVACSKEPVSVKKQILRNVIQNQKKLKKWAKHASGNYLNKWQLVEAEKARVEGNPKRAMGFYDLAVAGARENRFIQEEGMANELAAKFYLKRGDQEKAAAYMHKALYCYDHWGAKVKVDHLKASYPQLLADRRHQSWEPLIEDKSNVKNSQLDFASVMKASQVISGEIILDKLMDKMMRILVENAGAQTGYLILARGSGKEPELTVEAFADLPRDKVLGMNSLPLTEQENVALTVVNYVVRTGKHVIINSRAEQNTFALDPYFQHSDPKSILCAPISRHGRLVGILYLENNMMYGAFTPERIEVLTLLSFQAAISLENAGFYTELHKTNLCLQNEIVERRKAEQNYRGIFENAFEGIFQAAPDGGRVLRANPALAKILGYESPQMLIKSIPDLRNHFFADETAADNLFQRLGAAGLVKGFRTKVFTKDRRIMDISINAQAVRDETGNLIYYEGNIEDITQQKQAEKLRVDRDAAEKATLEKSRFLARMSHEIRTPMNAIIGLSDLAVRKGASSWEYDYLCRIKRSGALLMGIINDILDFSKIEAGKLELDQVDFRLAEVMELVQDMFAAVVREKGLGLELTIDPQVPPVLKGDPLRLGQVLINLVGNAVKFTEQGGILVKCCPAPECDRTMLAFSVFDTGVGISPDRMDELFEAFSQVDGSASRKHGGTGLGLTICKSLITAMGGTIEVVSPASDTVPPPVCQGGPGSIFSFTIGLEAGDENRVASATPVAILPEVLNRVKGARILIVDDNTINREMAADMLEHDGLMVETAGSGSQAIEMISQTERRYDAILMDIEMPGMDGYETTREIRKWEKEHQGSSVPIIALTAHAMGSIRKRCLQAGMDSHVAKPITSDRLLPVLAKWVQPAPQKEDAGHITAEETLGGFPDLVGLDTTSALKKLRGNQQLLEKFLLEFLAEHEGTAVAVKSALNQGDSGQAIRMVHNLRGVAGNLSARDLFHAAGVLQNSIKENRISQAHLEGFEASLDGLVQEIRKAFCRPCASQTNTIAATAPDLVSGLKTLGERLEYNHIDAEDCFHAIKGQLMEVGPPEKISELEEQIRMVEFRRARQTLADIVSAMGID